MATLPNHLDCQKKVCWIKSQSTIYGIYGKIHHLIQRTFTEICINAVLSINTNICIQKHFRRSIQNNNMKYLMNTYTPLQMERKNTKVAVSVIY